MTALTAAAARRPQPWKRARLAEAGLPDRGDVGYAEADLEAGALAPAGFDYGRPALISWLGVIMYLTPDPLAATLATLSRCAAGTELVAGYFMPGRLRDRSDALRPAGLNWLVHARRAGQ